MQICCKKSPPTTVLLALRVSGSRDPSARLADVEAVRLAPAGILTKEGTYLYSLEDSIWAPEFPIPALRPLLLPPHQLDLLSSVLSQAGQGSHHAGHPRPQAPHSSVAQQPCGPTSDPRRTQRLPSPGVKRPAWSCYASSEGPLRHSAVFLSRGAFVNTQHDAQPHPFLLRGHHHALSISPPHPTSLKVARSPDYLFRDSVWPLCRVWAPRRHWTCESRTVQTSRFTTGHHPGTSANSTQNPRLAWLSPARTLRPQNCAL